MGKIKVHKGSESFEIDAVDLPFAAKDGYLPTEKIVVVNSKNPNDKFEIEAKDYLPALKDGYNFSQVVTQAREAAKTNFERRINDPSLTIQNPDGTTSTHKMMSFEADGKYYAAPTIVEKEKGKLTELSQDDAIKYAFKNKEFKQFASEKEAQDYANNGYKKGTPLEEKVPELPKSTFTFQDVLFPDSNLSNEASLKLSDSGKTPKLYTPKAKEQKLLAEGYHAVNRIDEELNNSDRAIGNIISASKSKDLQDQLDLAQANGDPGGVKEKELYAQYIASVMDKGEVENFKSDLYENNEKSRLVLSEIARIKPDKKGQIESDLYLHDAQNDINYKAKDIDDNINKIKNQELEYDIKTRQLKRPTGKIDSFIRGWAERSNELEIAKKYQGANDGAAYLMEIFDKERADYDPHKPIPVAKGTAGHISELLGGQGVPILKGGVPTAVGSYFGVPQAGMAVGALLNADEFYWRGFTGSARQAYNEFLDQGIDKNEAIRKAISIGKVDGAKGAVQAALTTYVGGRVGVPTKAITWTAGYRNLASNLLKESTEFGKNFIKSSIPTQSIVGATEAASNIIANKALGQKSRQLGTNVADAILIGSFMELGIGGFVHGIRVGNKIVKALKPQEKAIVLQNMARQPEPLVDKALADMVDEKNITPEQAEGFKQAVNQQKQFDAQIPEHVTDADTRLEIQNKINEYNQNKVKLGKPEEGGLHESMHKPIKDQQKQIEWEIEILQEPSNRQAKMVDDKLSEIDAGIEKIMEKEAPRTAEQKNEAFKLREQKKRVEKLKEYVEHRRADPIAQAEKIIYEDIKDNYAEWTQNEQWRKLATDNPEGFLEEIAHQAQDADITIDGKTINQKARAEEMFGKELVKHANDLFPKTKPPAVITPDQNVPVETITIKPNQDAVQEQSSLTLEKQSNVESKANKDLFPEGAQEKSRINRESAQNIIGETQTSRLETSLEWMEAIRKNDTEKSRNAAEKLIRKSDDSEGQGNKLLDNNDAGGQALRAQGDNGENIGSETDQQGTRSSQESQRAGQQRGESGINDISESHPASLEGKIPGNEGEIDSLNQTERRTVVEEIQKLSELPNQSDKAQSERIVRQMLESAIRENLPNKAKEIIDLIQAQAEGGGNKGNIQSEDAGVGGGKPPKPPETISDAESAGRNELDKMSATIPKEGELREYGSKGTIEKYHQETPLNDQEILVQELMPALLHGEKIIEKAKEVFGQNYVEKTLDYIENSKAPNQSKALMYISLENALAREKQANPGNVGIQKLQDLVRTQSQAFLREASLAINFGKLRKIGETGFDVSKITESFFSPKEREAKATVEEAIQADADKINKQAEENIQKNEADNPELQRRIDEGIAAEIEKINKALPPDKKSYANKAVAALEKIQKKLRSKGYSDATGAVAFIDTGISVIKNAIKAGIAVSKAVELGIAKIKEKLGGKWAKEDEFRKDMLDAFSSSGVPLHHSVHQKSLAEQTLIDNGYGREINIKTANGTEKRNVLDWKKLAGAEGSIDKIKANVEEGLSKKGFSKEEIAEMKSDLESQYNSIRESVIDKSITELNKRNKVVATPEQKSAARKLSELYNYGLLDQNPSAYEEALSKAVGIKNFSKGRYEQITDLADAMAKVYSTKVNGRNLTDIELKSVIQDLEDKIRIVLREEATHHGSTALKIADYVRTYMDANQRMMLGTLKQAIENPFSGVSQNILSGLEEMVSGTSNKALRKQKRANATKVFKNMVLQGGVGYGDVNTTFVNKGNLDAYVNKLSDNQIVRGTLSTLIGKTHLDAADAFFKAKLTEQNFTHNLLKILQRERVVNGKTEPAMSKQDALSYVSEKLTGQSFTDAQKVAKDIIQKVNSGGKKIVGDSQTHIDRLANDIVKAALVSGKKISVEQVTAAYNAGYKAAGRSLGHEANNFISQGIQSTAAKIEKKINDAIKEKEYTRAAILTLQSVVFRNVVNPFLSGGTNWMVLKLEKNGLGLVTGLSQKIAGKRIDLSTDDGMKNLEKALYQQTKAKDAFMRGAVGAATSGLLTLGVMGIMDTEEFRKWRGKNKWLSKYTDLFTPEPLLATMYARDKEMGRYFEQLFNKNDAYSPSTKLIKGVAKIFGEDRQDKKDEGFGLVGEAVGGSLGIPLPWRLVRDGQAIWIGSHGEEPYKVEWGAESFMEGALKNGMIDYIKYNVNGEQQKEESSGGAGATQHYAPRSNEKRQQRQSR